jgi:hypothetical protein
MSAIVTYTIINSRNGKNAADLPIGKLKQVKASYNNSEEAKTVTAVLNRYAGFNLFSINKFDPASKGLGVKSSYNCSGNL